MEGSEELSILAEVLATLMEELVTYEPDLFIIYSGHNELLERRTYAGLIEEPQAIFCLQRGAVVHGIEPANVPVPILKREWNLPDAFWLFLVGSAPMCCVRPFASARPPR